MKTDAAEKKNSNKRQVKDLRYRLTAAFILFAVVLMALLWIFQSVFLDKYYELAMSRRCSKVVNSVASYYTSKTDSISMQDFLEFMGQKSADNDIFIRIESPDGSYAMSSSDAQKGGRFPIMNNTRELLMQARSLLKDSDKGYISFANNSRMGEKTYVYAKRVQSESNNPVYVFAIATLTPLGPAVGIIRSQLLIVTVAALIIGIFVARFTSKRLATPIADM